jgi:hypothetical protein
MFIPRKECPPETMVDWFEKNLKMNVYALVIAIVKDTDYNIPKNIPSPGIFDIHMTSPYAIVRLGDKHFSGIDVAMKEMQSILELANVKYNRWKDLKLVPEIASIQIPSRTFREKWNSVWEGCSYQYGENGWIDSTGIGFLWSIFYGIFYLICTAVVFVIVLPVLFIYEHCFCGLSELNKAIGIAYATGLYIPTNIIENEMLESMTALANKLSTDSKYVKVFRNQYKYIVMEATTEDDQMVNHHADLFLLCFESENHGGLGVSTVSVNIDAV